jgi:undecaprenyl-diphosphatase
LDLLKALVLGILQGATEFLPISSAGHHVAVLLSFWRDWLTLLRAGWTALQTRFTQDPDARLLLLILVGTVPAAVAGMMLENLFEAAFSDPPLVAFFLLVTAFLLVICERYPSGTRPSDGFGPRDVRFVGIAPAFAILPGISCSGSTMAAGIDRGLPRAAAACFSLLLAMPTILGAGAKQALDVLTGSTTIEHNRAAPLIVGGEAAAVVGFVCIRFLMRLLQQRRSGGFVINDAGCGTLSLLVALFT